MNITKKTIVLAVAFIVVAVGAFVGGMKYGAFRQAKSRFTAQGRYGQFGGPMSGVGGMMRGGARPGGGFTAGEVIAKDDKSITVKLSDGGSKIVFLNDSTSVMKSTSGTVADLSVGSQVIVAGAANADGSVNAQTVQIRPALPTGSTANAPKQ